MGGVGYSENIATRMIEDERPYTSIVLPVGLIQLLRYRNRFDPDDDNFDPVLAMEYAANPLHYVFGRDPSGNRSRFVEDAVNGELSRDLNRYRGFKPTNSLTAEGLASPNWGKTFKFAKRPDGAFQGFYLGAGPYLSARTALSTDKGLTDILGSASPVPSASLANRSFSIANASIGQIALAITGGYRARIALPGRSGRDGVYVGANYHYLRGFRYEDANIVVRFDTDQAGLLTVRPTTAPAAVDYKYARSGTGYAVDVGLASVVDRLELGFGANGLGNRIDWKNLSLRRYTLRSLVEGGDFVEQKLPSPASKLRMELPVDYTGSGAYHWTNVSAVAEVTRGFQGTRVHSGLEFRLGRIEFRGGARYSLDKWHPAGGIGLNLSERVSLDVAAFGSTTNIERELRPAIALSLRINRLR
ncbi:MAG: hypothetical protein AAB225_29260 [Acidobacteriota bacterium]